MLVVQFDVAEELEVDEEDREYGNFDSFEEDGDGAPRDGEGYQVARRSLASIFGEAEVVEVDEAQADESLLVSSLPDQGACQTRCCTPCSATEPLAAASLRWLLKLPVLQLRRGLLTVGLLSRRRTCRMLRVCAFAARQLRDSLMRPSRHWRSATSARCSPFRSTCFEPAQAGRDLIGRARTGSGKTLAFALPVIENLIQVIVLPPSIRQPLNCSLRCQPRLSPSAGYPDIPFTALLRLSAWPL